MTGSIDEAETPTTVIEAGVAAMAEAAPTDASGSASTCSPPADGHSGKSPIAALIDTIGQQARSACDEIAAADTATKNAALLAIADEIDRGRSELLQHNQADLKRAVENNISAALLDRLELNDARIESMIDGLRQVAALADPIGNISDLKYQPSGLQIGKMRVPLGVIGIIYESRPNVTADAAAICIKAGNAAILRGGSEAIESNRALAGCIQRGLQQAGLPAATVQLIDTTDREAVGCLLQATGVVDVIIPRGGKSLVARIAEQARVPVIKHLEGLCHVFIDRDADLQKAVAVAVNSKTYRYGICGAMETLLIDTQIAAQSLPSLVERLDNLGVELRGCERTRELAPAIKAATDADWTTEYLAPVLAVRIVDDVDAAMQHIARYGSSHTDAIVTDNISTARRFMRQVDSSSVMVNAATCFADGYQYGLGAEIGISTDKLHARGPVGVEGLTTEKYIVLGDGTVRT